MELILLAILITLLGAWPFIGGLLLVLIGLGLICLTFYGIVLACVWIYVWILENWNKKNIFAKTDSLQEKVPSWFGGDEQQWVEFSTWHEAFLQRIHNTDSKKQKDTVVSTKIPSWFGGDKKQWTEFQVWYRDNIQRIRAESLPKQKSEIVSVEVPPWFSGDNSQWLKFLRWYENNRTL